MGLTSGLFIALTVVVAVAAFTAAVIFLPRMTGAWWWVIARVVSLIVVCALVLVSAFAILNAQNAWYTNWSDLLGSANETGTTTTAGGTGEQPTTPTAKGAASSTTSKKPGPPKTYPALPSPGQRLQTYTWRGPASGFEAQVLVLLPSDYEAGVAAGTTYPVIEALHGYPAGPDAWLKAMDLQNRVDEAVKAGTMRPSVVVMPQLSVPTSMDNECVNGGPGQPQAETWLTKDIRQFAVERFAVQAERDAWVAAGYSTGGWCSAMVAMLHPDMYAGAMSLGGYFQPDFTGSYKPFAQGSEQWKRYDLVALAGASPPPVKIWAQAGNVDGASTKSFVAAAKSPLSVTSVIIPNAGHRTQVWADLLPRAFEWLGTSVPAFKP